MNSTYLHVLLGWVRILVSVIASFVTVPILIHRITTEGYGTWLFLQDFSNYGDVLYIGANAFLIQQVARQVAVRQSLSTTLSQALGLYILMGFCVAAAIVVTVPLVVDSFQNSLSSELAVQIKKVAIVVAINAWRAFITAPFASILQGASRWVVVNCIDILHSLARLALIALSLSQGDSLIKLAVIVMAVDIAFGVLTIAAARVFVPQEIPGIQIPSRQFVWQVYSFGIVASLMLMYVKLIHYADTLIVGFMRGAEAVAYFSVPQQMASYFGLIASVIAQVMYPKFSCLDARSATHGLREGFVSSSFPAAVLMGACAGGVCVVAPDFVRLWIQDAQYVAFTTLLIIPQMLIALLRGLYLQLPISMLIAANQASRGIRILAIEALVKIIVSIMALRVADLWTMCICTLLISAIFDVVIFGRMIGGVIQVTLSQQLRLVLLPTVSSVVIAYTTFTLFRTIQAKSDTYWELLSYSSLATATLVIFTILCWPMVKRCYLSDAAKEAWIG